MFLTPQAEQGQDAHELVLVTQSQGEEAGDERRNEDSSFP